MTSSARRRSTEGGEEPHAPIRRAIPTTMRGRVSNSSNEGTARPGRRRRSDSSRSVPQAPPQTGESGWGDGTALTVVRRPPTSRPARCPPSRTTSRTRREPARKPAPAGPGTVHGPSHAPQPQPAAAAAAARAAARALAGARAPQARHGLPPARQRGEQDATRSRSNQETMVSDGPAARARERRGGPGGPGRAAAPAGRRRAVPGGAGSSPAGRSSWPASWSSPPASSA